MSQESVSRQIEAKALRKLRHPISRSRKLKDYLDAIKYIRTAFHASRYHCRYGNKGNQLADVGCDHGYLSIWLVSEKKQFRQPFAMDVRPGPLSRARRILPVIALKPWRETRLSDGLAKQARRR